MEQLDKHQRLQELYSERKALEELLDHRGWRLLKATLDEQCRLRRVNLFTSQIDGLDKCFELARTQGEVAGLQAASVLADVLISDRQADINNLLTQIREEEENERSRADAE